jgi:hypothetical protein
MCDFHLFLSFIYAYKLPVLIAGVVLLKLLQWLECRKMVMAYVRFLLQTVRLFLSQPILFD